MITIIGGSGFIGTYFCVVLKKSGIPFEIVDLNKSPLFPDQTKIADIRDEAALAVAVTGDVIVHLAAVHRDDVRDRSKYYKTNVKGTINICRLAEARKIERIVFTSTVAVYGFASPDTDESGAINPFNDYGQSKFDAEKVLRAWHRSSSETRSLTIIRPTVVFGEGNRGNVYNLFRQIQSGKFVMIGAGENKKSMAYVGNVAAFLSHVSQTGEGYCLFNYVDKPDFDMNTLVDLVRSNLLGKNGVGPRLPLQLGLALGAIADLVARLFRITLPISSIRVRKFVATTSFFSAAHQVDGFTAPFSLVEGVERTLNVDFLNPDPEAYKFFTE